MTPDLERSVDRVLAKYAHLTSLNDVQSELIRQATLNVWGIAMGHSTLPMSTVARFARALAAVDAPTQTVRAS